MYPKCRSEARCPLHIKREDPRFPISNFELECFNYILSTCVYLGRKPNYICDSYNSLLSTFLVYKFSNQHLYYIVSPFVGGRLTSPPHMEIQIRIQIIIFKPYVRELFRAIEKYSYIFMFIKNNKKTFISATQCYTVPWDIIGAVPFAVCPPGANSRSDGT